MLFAIVLSIAPGCQSAGDARSSARLAAARRAIGHDAVVDFRQNQQAKSVPFYSYGSLVKGDHFPGLGQADVKLWIEEHGHPWKRMFQDDPAPFFVVDEGVTMEEYWNAVQEFLTTYNRLVLASLKEGHNQAAEPTRTSVTPTGKAPAAPTGARGSP